MPILTESIFNEKLNQPVVHEALRWLQASQRQGTHSAKTRTEVSGGGAKPWKQKGTGRARAGSNRSPLWRKGGVIFPPKPRDYSYALPVKVRKLAVRVVLSELNRRERVKVVDQFSLPRPKAKEGARLIKSWEINGSVILVTGQDNPEFEKGMRNLAGVKLVSAKGVNLFDLLKAEWLVIEKTAVKYLEERLA